MDNSIGYIPENVQSCCRGCNYMKRQDSLENFFEKLVDIFKNTEHSAPKDLSLTSNLEVRNIVESGKKSKEEIKEDARIRKQKQRDALKARYGDEEYKNLRAHENLQRREAEKKTEKVDEETKSKKVQKSEDEIREAARLRKQKQRESLVQKLGQEEYRKSRAEEYIQSKAVKADTERDDEKAQKVQKTEDQLREDARNRKQKQRQHLKLELGEEEYRKMRRLESEKKKESSESI
jgi:hypothetical protein